MIINSIMLHNFGVYAGRQVVDLSPMKGRPVILFGGLNGGGKTTFLDAIQLCLFGCFAKCSNRSSFSYEEYLRRSINRSALEREAAVELSFVQREAGAQNEYKLHRSWMDRDGKIKETFLVVKNGKFDQALTENWGAQVEDFMPLNISSLFLFDGEKIEAYANPENSGTLINTAIQSLLGLDIVDQLERDLLVFERKKKVASATPAVQKHIEEDEDKLRFLQERLQKSKQEAAALKTHEIDVLQKQLSAVEKEFSKKGGDLYQKREQIASSYKNSQELLSKTKEEMRAEAETALPLMLVSGLMKKTLARAIHEESVFVATKVEQAIEARDHELMKRLKKMGAGNKPLSLVQAFISEDKKRRARSSAQPLLLNMSQQAKNRLHELVTAAPESFHKKRIELTKKYDTAEASLNRWEQEFHNIPTKDDIRYLHEKSNALREKLSNAQLRHQTLMLDCEHLSVEIEKKKSALARVAEQKISSEIDAHDIMRLTQQSERARKTLQLFKKEVLAKHIASIETTILECFQLLIRKTSFIKDLKICPETFDISLFTGEGQILSAERLSAGERQLLAIAILWGLAKTSGRPLPTAIDTPLGRLDSSHRENIVRRYFPFASHQVLLFSTDQEIMGGYLDSLKPWIGRSYTLEFTQKGNATHIRDGYFQLSEAQ